MIEKKFVNFVKKIYKTKSKIELHEPSFNKIDYKLINDTIKSGFVSSIGKNIDKFSNQLSNFTGSKYVIPVSNGTAGIYLSLYASGVTHGDEVIVPSYTFVGTCNPIKYLGANPVFIDIEQNNLSLDVSKLDDFLNKKTVLTKKGLINKISRKVIKACIAVHPYGLSCENLELKKLCKKYKIVFIEDAAEALGSFKNNRHAGLEGDMSILSFNGNKIITTGGGGAILTQNYNYFKKLKHISTTSLVRRKLNYNYYDQLGFNCRMPNLNAALGISQLKKIKGYLNLKKNIHYLYKEFFDGTDVKLFSSHNKSDNPNYWLNTVKFNSLKSKENFIKYCISKNVNVKPGWIPLHYFNHFKFDLKGNLDNTEKIYKCIVNLPSSPNIK